MTADDFRHLVGLRRPDLLQPASHPHVEPRALGPGKARVANIAKERVSDDERFAEEIVDEWPVHEPAPLECGYPFRLVSSEHTEHVTGKPSSGHRCSTDDRPRGIWQIVELSCVHTLDCRGELDLIDRTAKPPARWGLLEQPASYPGSEELLDEQRIAFGSLGDTGDQFARESIANESADELGSRLGRQRLELEDLSARDPLVVGLEQGRARRADDQAALAFGGGCQERAVVLSRPMQILDEPHLGGGESCEARGPGGEASRATRLGLLLGHSILEATEKREQLVGYDH
ncbi:hypothetical protein BH20ACT14_BH20ACT14_10240 [soil metagenome]